MKTCLLIVGLLMQVAVFAQQDSLKPTLQLGDQVTDFAVDNLGNIFLISESGQLKKLAPNGDSVAVFNDIRRFGKVFAIDVSNPLKVLLFYKDFGTVVVLDRLLNVRNTIDLRKQQIFQARAIGQSFDNGIWVYDELAGKLKRLDDNGSVISESADFRVLFDNPPSPVQLIDANRLVYVYDPEKGLIVLDYFGTVRNKVALLGWSDVQVIGSRVLGRKGTVLESYTVGALDMREQDLKGILEGTRKTQISMDHVYCLTGGVLHIYTLSNREQP